MLVHKYIRKIEVAPINASPKTIFIIHGAKTNNGTAIKAVTPTVNPVNDLNLFAYIEKSTFFAFTIAGNII